MPSAVRPMPSLTNLHDDALQAIIETVAQLAPVLREKQGKNALISLSMASKRLRILAAPVIFRAVHVHLCNEIINTFAWDGRDDFGISSTVPEALKTTKSLALHCSQILIRGFMEITIPFHLVITLANVLETPTRLRKLSIIFPRELGRSVGQIIPYVDDADSDTLPGLENVREIAVSPCCEFIITHCPNVVEVMGFGYDMRSDMSELCLIQAAASRPRLHTFGIDVDMQRDHICDNIHSAMPNLAKLIMPVHGLWVSHPYRQQCIINTVSKFQNLRSIILPGAESVLAAGVNGECLWDPEEGLIDGNDPDLQASRQAARAYGAGRLFNATKRLQEIEFWTLNRMSSWDDPHPFEVAHNVQVVNQNEIDAGLHVERQLLWTVKKGRLPYADRRVLEWRTWTE